MADTEGVDQLFPGWSSVVHRPSEDPEPSDLPSTVDMNAVFNAEVNAAPATNLQEVESSDSDSDSDSDSNVCTIILIKLFFNFLPTFRIPVVTIPDHVANQILPIQIVLVQVKIRILEQHRLSFRCLVRKQTVYA